MPYKKRKYSKRRRKKRGFQLTRQIGSAPVSKTQVTKLVFCEQIALDPGVGLVSTATYNAGGCFDPRVAIGGLQPRGFDQWMAFYEHFVVLGSKITLMFQTTGLQPSDGNGIVGVYLKANSIQEISTIPELIEQQNSVYKPISPIGGSNSTVIMQKNYSAKKFLGRASVLSDPTLKGTITADPTESAYYEIVVGASNNGDNLGSVRCLVKIEYIVALIEPKPLPSS